MARTGLAFAFRAALLFWLVVNSSTDWVGKGSMKEVVACMRTSSPSMGAREAFWFAFWYVSLSWSFLTKSERSGRFSQTTLARKALGCSLGSAGSAVPAKGLPGRALPAYVAGSVLYAGAALGTARAEGPPSLRRGLGKFAIVMF